MVIKPKLFIDEEGRTWLKPGLFAIHARMLGLEYHDLERIAREGSELEVPDEWPEAKCEEYRFGNSRGIRITWA